MRCALIGCLMLAALAAGASAAEFTVAPDGSDSAAGTASAPFATLERARDAVRALRKAGPVTVWIAGGTYYRDHAFELGADDSGTAESPIVYTGRPGETVRIVGGRAVDGFRPVTDEAVLKRLDPAARSHVLVADLRAQGITDYGKLTAQGFGRPQRPVWMELSFRGRPMTLARWPNEGFVRIAATPAGKNGGLFAYSGERPARWVEEPDAWLHGYWFYDWADTYESIARIDTANHTIRTRPPHGAYGYKKGQRYYALNLLCELDSPGEYYVDRTAGLLYFWPPAPIRAGDAVVSMIPTLVSLHNVTNVTFRGLTLGDCRGTAVTMTGGAHDRVADCVIRNTGGAGVSVSGGTDNGVTGCDIHATGQGGVLLSGGDRKALTPAGNFAEDDEISDFSRVCRTYRPAVGVRGVGNRVSHNLIHDGPHCAILLGGNDHLIEFNEIHHVCTECGDCGAFYMGRDWTARGTVIRYNFFHDISGPGLYGAQGVYLDDAACGITIFGNVFYRVTKAAFIGGGRDNTVENNLFIDCKPALHVDARALGWMSKSAAPGGVLRQRLEAMPYRRPPWSTRYPKLVDILDDDPAAPKGNLIARNVQWGGKWDDVEGKARPYLSFEENLLGVDPRCVDPAKMDFRLRKDSPAWGIGFKPIPFGKIGPQKANGRLAVPRTTNNEQRTTH